MPERRDPPEVDPSIGGETAQPTGGDDAEDLRRKVEALEAERVAMRAQLDDRARKREGRRRARDIAVAILAVVSVVLVVVGSTALWVRQTLLDTDRFVATVAPIAGDPAVEEAVAARLTEQLVTDLNLQGEIAEELPPDVVFIAPAITTAVSQLASGAVERVLATEAFQTVWEGAARVAHTEVLAVLRGEGEVVTTEGDTVYLNLLPVINQALSEVEQQVSEVLGRDISLPEVTPDTVPDEARQQISDALGVELSDEFGVIPVFQADRLPAAQEALRVFDRTTLALVVLAPLAVAGTLWLSRRRRRTLIGLTIGSMVGLVVVRNLARWTSSEVVAQTPRPENREAVDAVLGYLTGGFFGLTGWLLVIGALVLLAALVTGPYPWARSFRAGVAGLTARLQDPGAEGAPASGPGGWVADHATALQVAGALIWVLAVLVLDLTWVGFLVAAAVLAAYELVLWRLRPVSPEPAEDAMAAGEGSRRPDERRVRRRAGNGARAGAGYRRGQ